MLLANLTINVSVEDVSGSMLWILVPLVLVMVLRRALPFVKSTMSTSRKVVSEIPFISIIAPPLLVLALLPVALSKLEPNFN
jgi:hypothetical protein